jgi:hypothetical protein
MTRKGRKWTIEQRKVQSDCKKKYWIDHPEQKEQVSKSSKGRLHSIEDKIKQSNAQKGRIVSEETRLKISNANKISLNKPEYKISVSGPNSKNWKENIKRRKPMEEAKDCPLYLGVYVAENVLSTFFDNITRMPFGHHGFDYICGKGFKIDVKSACLHNNIWTFYTRRNTVADYFLCLGFDNRNDLNPLHVWLFPNDVTNSKASIQISNGSLSIKRRSKYERPLDKVLECCNKLKTGIL